MSYKTIQIILFAALGIVIFSGCSSKRSQEVSAPVEQKIRKVADPAELLMQLQERNRAINNLRTSNAEFQYRMTNQTSGYEGTEIRFAVQKPGKVYARASATGVGNVFFLHTDGERYWVEATREDKVFTGTVRTDRHMKVRNEDEIWKNLNPSVLFQALLIDNLDEYAYSSFAIEPDFYIISLFEESEGSDLNLRRQIWIERENLTVERHRVYNKYGELETEAYLYRYSDVDGIALPHYLRIERSWESISIKFTLDEIILNGTVPEDLFRYKEPPASFEVIDLDKREQDAEPGKS